MYVCYAAHVNYCREKRLCIYGPYYNADKMHLRKFLAILLKM